MKVTFTSLVRNALLSLAFLVSTPSVFSGEIAPDPRFQWFHQAKVGMFIHWGPYSVAAGEWQGKSGNRDAHMLHEFRIPLATVLKLETSS